MTSDLDATIEQLCVLRDPVRRSVYVAVRKGGRPLTRIEVAESTGVSVRLATFHLEKLVDEGFLEGSYARGEGAPSAGRPAKRYAPTGLELEVAIPPRRYDIAADILAAVLEGSTDAGERAAETAAVAADYGRGVGRRVRRHSRLDDRLLAALEIMGYEPGAVDGDLVLHNCPFHRAAQGQPEIICPMNQALVEGVLEGLRRRSHVPVLAREPGRCCVVLRAVRPRSNRA